MDVKLPKLGEGAESGVVVGILVKEGDRVSEGQTLIELENEKAVAPIPSSAAGIVSRIRVKEGDRISAGAVILSRGGEGEETAAPAPAAAAAPPPAAGRKRGAAAPAVPVMPAAEATTNVAVVEEIPQRSEAPLAAPPAIRRLARELGIDLARVRGTERGGRIGMTDLRAYVELVQRLAFQRREPAAKESPATPAAERVDFSKWGPITRKPLSALRQTIRQRMSASWTAVPRVTQFDEADITRLMELRKKHAPAYEAKGTKLTVTPLLVQAVARTLRQHPLLNCSLDEAANELVLKDYVHIGLAVDTEAGLIVPVIRDADRKSVLQLAQEVESLAARARERKVSLEELRGGTFTISNQGGIGGAHFTPIVNLPEVAILGLGRGAMKPVVRDKKIEPRLLLPLALSYDHRVIDGATAARFVTDLVKAFQEFPEDQIPL